MPVAAALGRMNGGGIGAMPDPLSRIAKSNGLQRAASCGSSPKGTPFAGEQIEI